MKSPVASSPDITRSSSKPTEKVYTKGSRKKSKELKEAEKKKLEKASGKRVGKQKAISKEKVAEKPALRGRRGEHYPHRILCFHSIPFRSNCTSRPNG